MQKSLIAVLFGISALSAVTVDSAAAAERLEPVFYEKSDSWQESLRLSREALTLQMAAKAATNLAAAKAADPALANFESWQLIKICNEVPTSNMPSYREKIELQIRGLKNLYLGSNELERGWNAVIFSDAVLIDKAGKKTPLLSLKPTSWKGSQDKDALNPERRQICLSRSELCFTLDGKFERLEASMHANFQEGVIAWISGYSRFDESQSAIEGRLRIQSRLEADFASAEAKEQLHFEQRDYIWTKEWTPGQVDELAWRYAAACQTPLKETAKALAPEAKTVADLAKIRALYHQDIRCRQMLAELEVVKAEAMVMAIDDLSATFAQNYPKGAEFKSRAAETAAQMITIREKLKSGDDSVIPEAKQILAFQKEALLANPLLNFDKLLMVRRKGADNLGLSNNFSPNINPGNNAEIMTLSPVGSTGELTTLFAGKGVIDIDLEFDAGKMLFTMADANGIAQIWEIDSDGRNLRQISASESMEDPVIKSNPVHNCDACYLPDGKIIFVSTATMIAVPCLLGNTPVGNLYRMDGDGKNIMQLTFDQDQNWYPTVDHNGRVMYLRWEYTDTAHYFTRLLFTMNPDGTSQSALYGSNSYWPNSIFFARPIPHHPTRVVGIVSGHHGVSRVGELVIFDPAKGRHEADGVIQRIPGYGKKVEPIIKDQLVNDSWPKFAYPYPLADESGRGAGKYFLVSCKLNPDSPWGIYLADIFDNMVPLQLESGYAFMQPIPLQKRPRPPVVPDRIDLQRKDGVIYLQDIYSGPGLSGVPRGVVKNLRLFTYAYNYRHMGSWSLVGQESGWDVKRILGTVPVNDDGSAMFRVPANTPIAIQPLDCEGRALQLMRSWMTARPGEVLSCVGCHENNNSTPLTKRPTAAGQSPSEIQPFYGPSRGFSFEREIQPVLDKFCIACHDGKARSDGKKIPDFANCEIQAARGLNGMFSQSYLALNPFVRRPGPESDYHMFTAMEWHADTSPLIQMLKKGHHNVKLTQEAWHKLYTWIDLNVPFYGTYRETQGKSAWNPRSEQAAVRYKDLIKRYANIDIDPEKIPAAVTEKITPIMPEAVEKAAAPEIKLANWPFDEAAAKKMQAAAAKENQKKLTLEDGMELNLCLIPAGEFIMGDAAGYLDEQPRHAVKIEKPFWMAEVEISNQLFSLFDPTHDSRYQDMPARNLTARGYPANLPQQPVVRVSFTQAIEFCQWLSLKTGKKFSLPSEAQWEWACRAGSETASVKELGKYNTKWDAAANVGSSVANPWGVKDLYGNVSEWTTSAYRPYPYQANDGRNALASAESKVTRGGSWEDSLTRVRAGIRIPYQPYRRLHNVGFRVICEVD